MSFNFLSKTGKFANGLVGTVGYTVYKPDGTEQTVRTTDGIVAIGATGYAAVVLLPSDGAYVIQWDDGSAHYDYDSPPIAILADGVAHGGTPGSSTATLALDHMDVTCATSQNALKLSSGVDALSISSSLNRAIFVDSHKEAIYINGAHDNSSDAVVIAVYGGSGSCINCSPGDSGSALHLHGPYTTPGPVVLIDATAADTMLDGGPGIKIRVAGSGQKAILLSADVATDALSIVAGAGTPIDIFDDTGAVRTTGGGGGSGPVTLDLTQVVPTINTPQTVGDALNVTRPVTVDLTQVIPTTNTEQTIGDALNAARSMGFGALSINKIAKTLTLFAPNGTTPVHVFNLDNVSSPTSRT